jgi:hypothetical protein
MICYPCPPMGFGLPSIGRAEHHTIYTITTQYRPATNFSGAEIVILEAADSIAMPWDRHGIGNVVCSNRHHAAFGLHFL